jgi:hypothetical protein
MNIQRFTDDVLLIILSGLSSHDRSKLCTISARFLYLLTHITLSKKYTSKLAIMMNNDVHYMMLRPCRQYIIDEHNLKHTANMLTLNIIASAFILITYWLAQYYDDTFMMYLIRIASILSSLIYLSELIKNKQTRQYLYIIHNREGGVPVYMIEGLISIVKGIYNYIRRHL